MKPPSSGPPIKRTTSIKRTDPEGVRLIKAVVNTSMRLTPLAGIVRIYKIWLKISKCGLVLTNESQLKPAYLPATLIYYFEFDVDSFLYFT